ncbi:hypothetical protein [Flavobacterium sp.]|uniref:hypothetical protein n=1 Tax=Flavobacterium sp. TaxID=239 RepID=UPI00286DAC6B|nr:hypothetical protein [Flavobacterium sp.]
MGVNVISFTNMIAQSNSYPSGAFDGGTTQQNFLISKGDSGYPCYIRLHRNVLRENDDKQPTNGISYMLNNLDDGFSISRSTANNKGFNIKDIGTKDFIIDKSGNASFNGNMGLGADKQFFLSTLNNNGWRMGVQNNPFSPMRYPDQYTSYLTIPDGKSNFAVGQNGGASLFEINAETDGAWFRGNVEFSGGIQIGNSGLGNGVNGYGPKLSFSTPTSGVNDDNLYIQRINETNGGSNIFVNIGNDNSATNLGVRDTFTIGNDGTGAGSLNSFPYFVVNSAGYVGIGTNGNASQELMVGGGVGATNYTVISAPTADYVFEDSYKLKTLAETEAYIKENKHLPAFKSSKHYEANGYTMIDMDVALEQTVEELTLHAIAQEKKINEQETEMAQLKSEMAAIKALLLKK